VPAVDAAAEPPLPASTLTSFSVKSELFPVMTMPKLDPLVGAFDALIVT
jgi:hypothetical protein